MTNTEIDELLSEDMQDVSSSRKKRVRRIGKWSQNELPKLISLFEQRPVLWDFTKKEYRNRGRRMEETTKIAKILNKKRNEVEAQWNNLRGKFRRAQSKLARSKSGQGTEKGKVRFPYYEQMSFLKTATNEDPLGVPNYDEDSSSWYEETASPAKTSPPPIGKRQRTEDEKKPMLPNAYEAIQTRVEQTSNQAPNVADGFDSFGAMIASLLRELENKVPIVRHELQVNIQKAVLNAQTKLFEHEINSTL